MKRPLLPILLLLSGIAIGIIGTTLSKRPSVEPQASHSSVDLGEKPLSSAAPPVLRPDVASSSSPSRDLSSVVTPSTSPLPLATAPRSGASDADKPRPNNTLTGASSRSSSTNPASVPDHFLSLQSPTSVQGAPQIAALQSSATNAGSSENTSQQASSIPATNLANGGAAAAELNVPVPGGAVVPAAFYDTDPKSPQQQAALDRILKEFNDNVSQTEAGVDAQENWDEARKIADNQYLTLYGWQAYNARHIQAAKEALVEKRAAATPSPAIP